MPSRSSVPSWSCLKTSTGPVRRRLPPSSTSRGAAASQSVLVVATYRSEAVAAGDLFAALRRRLASKSLAGHIALSGLSLEEVGELVQFVPGLPEDRSTLSRDIAQTSGGNPLFAGELIRNRIEAPSSSEIPRRDLGEHSGPGGAALGFWEAAGRDRQRRRSEF